MQNEFATNRYEICVGFNDGDEKIQKYSEETYEKIITNVCKGYKVCYSISKMSGGFIHEDGTFVKENSACIMLIGVTDEQVEEIAKDLCAFFNQASVMIIKSDVSVTFVSDSIFK